MFPIPNNAMNLKLQKILSSAFDTMETNPEGYLEGDNLVKIIIKKIRNIKTFSCLEHFMS